MMSLLNCVDCSSKSYASRENKPASDYQPFGTDSLEESRTVRAATAATDQRVPGLRTPLCSCYFTQAVNTESEVTEKLASRSPLCGATRAESTAKEAEKTPNAVQPEVESAKMC